LPQNEKLTKAFGDLKQINANAKQQITTTQADDLNLERIRQALEYLAIMHKNEIESSSFKHQTFSNDLKLNLNEIIRELENISSNHSLRNGVSFNSMPQYQQQTTPANTNLELKLIEQNRELLNAFKKVSDEKIGFRNLISKMEEEIWMHRNRSKNENQSHPLTDNEREKFKKLYYKYLRAESFRKSLVYQKRFLLIMLSGYEETEREILATLKIESSMSKSVQSNSNNRNANNNNNNNKIISTYQNNCSIYSNRFILHKAKSRFRTGVICIIAISRIKYGLFKAFFRLIFKKIFKLIFF
jgi:hypothetical protein